MKTLFPRISRFVNGNTIVLYANYPRITNWKIPFISQIGSGQSITTEDGVAITTEDGQTIVTE